MFNVISLLIFIAVMGLKIKFITTSKYYMKSPNQPLGVIVGVTL